jgi:hypothetical protein
MNDENIQQKIQQKVFERLTRGNVTMRSRAYFVGRAALAILVMLVVLALSAYVLSFIMFSIHESGEQFLLGFGERGLTAFLKLFPWGTLIVDIALIFFLEWLLQSFKFGYRFSLVAVFWAVVLASMIIAALIGLTPIHNDFLEMADRGDLPVVGEMYESVRGSHEEQGVFRGTIVAIQGDTITITHEDGDHDTDDGTRTVTLPSGYSTTTFSVGERVYVFGTQGSTTIQAYGVDHLSPDQ